MPTPAFPENQEKRAPGVHSGRRRRGLVEPEIYSGGGPQEQPPSLDEPVGGKLIRFLYCRRNRESFQFLMDFWYKKSTSDYTHNREEIHAINGRINSDSRLPRFCCVFPAAGPHAVHHARGYGGQLSRFSHSWRKTCSWSALRGDAYEAALLQAPLRKLAIVKNHRGISQTDRICGSWEPPSGDPVYL